MHIQNCSLKINDIYIVDGCCSICTESKFRGNMYFVGLDLEICLFFPNFVTFILRLERCDIKVMIVLSFRWYCDTEDGSDQ